MVRFEDLLAHVREYVPDAELEVLRRAYTFAALEHKGQVRHSGEPYLAHSLNVASSLVELRLDVPAITAGLLHDVVEDTLTTLERVQELFGEEIAHLVDGVTKIGAIPFASSEERQAENFRKMLLAMVDDVRVILVKLADRLDNMRTLQHLPEERRQMIARDTLEIYAPIAGRLGIDSIKSELENLAFISLEPRAYELLRARVEEHRQQIGPHFQKLKDTIATKLTDGHVDVVAIEGRIKDLYSLHHKMRRQRVDLERIHDFVAFRVVTRSTADCYRALGLIHQLWSPIPGALKDFIAMPRPNGYQSLHTSVVTDLGFPLEVQIRTEEMNHVAQYGVAAHWLYKERRADSHGDTRYFLWMRHLLEWQSEVRDPHEFIQNLKIDLYPDEVYIFTPQGTVKALPTGATPIDFAYAVHTDLGHSCAGARVNGKQVPLRTRLKNGDIVEILTAEGHRPSRDWLTYVVTSRARSKIKAALRIQDRLRTVEMGRRLLELELARRNATSAVLVDELISDSAKKLGFASNEDLLEAIGSGRVAPRQLMGRLAPDQSVNRATPDAERNGTDTGSLDSRSLRGRIAVDPSRAGTVSISRSKALKFFRARCCEPTTADQIVGRLARDGSIAVHRVTCHIAQSDGSCIGLRWLPDKSR
jgi:GTP diphosphokinase / guanosine-3',5'-bis(diphosphate) 3'-diphosphatase